MLVESEKFKSLGFRSFVISNTQKPYAKAVKDKASLNHKAALDAHEDKLERMRMEIDFNDGF